MAEHAEHGAAGEHAKPAHHVNYWAIFGALCILTLISAAADLIGGKGGASGHGAATHGEAHAAAPAHGTQATISGKQLAVVLIVMAVAIAKAMFVLMYFMHVKFEGRWIYAMLLPTTVLAMAIPAALLPDIGLHYYTIQTPQTEEYSRLQTSASEHHSPGMAAPPEPHAPDARAPHPDDTAGPGEKPHP